MSSEQNSSASLDDSRKRKSENVDDDSAKVKIAKPSLGLSLLQSYDAEDDYMTSDEEPTSPSAGCVDSTATRNVFIEEMTDEDQADENLTDQILSVNSEAADSSSLSETNKPSSDTSEFVLTEIDDTPADDTEKSVDESNENVLNIEVPEISTNDVHVEPVESSSDVSEIVDAKTSSFDEKVETEPAKKDSADEFEVNKVEPTEESFSDSKSVDSCQTNVTKESESKPDIRPDYNFSVFGTSGEIGSPDSVSSKPAKKVKLNRSKFIRSVDESSNEAKPNAMTFAPVLASSESDSKLATCENSIPVKSNVEAIENKIHVVDQITEEISAKPIEIIEEISGKIEDSLEKESPLSTHENDSVENIVDLNQLVSEPPATKDIDLPSKLVEENDSLVEDEVAKSVENAPEFIEEMIEQETSTSKTDSLVDAKSVLVDEEIVGLTDIPDIMQKFENYDNPHDMIEVIDQDISAAKDEIEELKNDEAPINAVEDLVEELMDENSVIQESTNEGIIVEELESENTVVELTDAAAFVEEVRDEKSFVESKDENQEDENSVIEESNEDSVLDTCEELKIENPCASMEDLNNEKADASPLSFDADQEHSFDSNQSPDEDDENETESNVEIKDTSEPPHRPLKIIIRKKEEKLVVVEDVPRSKRRGRKSAKKLQKEKSKMKGAENKKIVDIDESANFEVNIADVENVGEVARETTVNVDLTGAIKETDDAEMKEEAIVSAVSETTSSTFVAAESDDELFKDAMDTLESVPAEIDSEKQAGIFVPLSGSEQSSSLSNAAVEPVEPAVPDMKLMQHEEPNLVESSLDKVTNETMEIDVEEASVKTVAEVPSKLEQALTRKLKIDKKIESSEVAPASQLEVSGIDKPTLEAPPEEPPPVKENLKLHLSVQGNRVSIKKNVAAETVAPLPDTTVLPSPVADPETPPPRVKRQYRKRAKPTIDPALLTEEKSYTLRTRNTKNPPEEVTPKKPKGRKSAAAVATAAATADISEASLPIASPAPKKEKVLREAPLPVTVEIDQQPDRTVTTPAGKVKPIRLKIKNPGLTMECTSKYSPVTIEKISGPEKGVVSDNFVDILEEARQKESLTIVAQEQPSWSGTDLQRVERLLKESNVTITPVSSASQSVEPIPSPSSILKPILTAAKEKSARKVMHKAPPLPPSSSSTVGAASITPIFGDNRDTSAATSFARNLNVILKPLDFEEQLSQWKISKPGQEMDVARMPSTVADQPKQQPVDVKLEIRKKIASSERRRQIQEPEVVITVDDATPNLEQVYQSKRNEDMLESKPPVKVIRRKSKSRPAGITIIEPTSEVAYVMQKNMEKMSRLPSKSEAMDEFILPDSTPSAAGGTNPIAENVIHDRSQAEIIVVPKDEPQVMLEPKQEAQVTLDPKVEDIVIVEPEAEAAATLQLKDEVQILEPRKEVAVVTPSADAQVTTPPLVDVEVEVKPEIEILEHISHLKADDVTTESTLKVENVEPVASKSETPMPMSVHELVETSAEVKREIVISLSSSSDEEDSAETKSGVAASSQPAPEVKLMTAELKPKIGKQMPDLLPINKQPMTLKSVQIPPVTSQLPHVSSLSTSAQSQLASALSQAAPVTPNAVPSSPAAQQAAIPAQFVPMTPQIKLSVAPLTSKMLQEALAAPQFTPTQYGSPASFMGSSVGTPMSMTPCTPRVADSSLNTPSRSFADSTTPSYSNLPPLMFPKKRGRPTKAMVAAREAYRQSQEAIEGFKRHNVEPTAADAGSTPQSMAPGDESSLSNISIDLLKLPIKRGRKLKAEKSDQTDGSDDNTSAEKLPMDPEREMEELKRLEEDRVRKEQERERKNELRRQKAKERSDLEKAKKLRQRQKAEERHKKVQEQRRLLQEQKKKLEEEIKKLPGFEAGRVTTADVSQMSNGSFLMDDDSNSTSFDPMQRLKKTKMEVYDPDGNNLTVDQIAEYQWPIQGGELYMIQEQISNFLGVKSFKRKYPDIKRRPVDSEERAYLVDSGLVSETLCDLGITAVCSAEVLDIMCSDFAEKYEELRKHMREKQMKELSFKQKAWANGLGYKLLMADGSKQDLKKRAMESVSNWNSALNKSRLEDRRSAIDLQTFIIHYPKSKTQNMTTPSPKIGSYPVSILPGQFCDFYKEYTSTELRYMPLNTVIYGPVRHPSAAKDVDGSQTDSDDSSSSDESSSTTSEGTQATEDTLEDMDKDMSLDESLLAEKLPDGNTSLREDRDRREMANGVADSKQEDGKILCKACLGDENRNKENVAEVLICCSQCCSSSHPTCLDLSLNMVPHIKSYNWQCPDCKNCARCKEYADEDKMLFCDLCDRGYHIYCVGLKKVPSGSWQCHECAAVDDPVDRDSSMLAPTMPASIPIKIEG